MNTKIPSDAFTAYCALGPGRSYEALAKKYGVSKRAVTKLAARDKWSARLGVIEQKARERADQKVLETLEDMNERHLVAVKFLQRKALDTLRTMPLASAIDAVRALDLSIRQERLIRGEPTDRAAIDVEQVLRNQFERWIVRDGSETGGRHDNAA